MSEHAKSWGLPPNQRLMVLGIRAAGLLLTGLGVPVLSVLIWTVYRGGWTGSPDGGDESWTFGSFLELVRTKVFIIQFVSSTGVYMMAFIAGAYLMRCDPRPLLRSVGVKV